MMGDMGNKRCLKCGELLPVESFSKNRAAEDRLRSWCKACSKACLADWRHLTGRQRPMADAKDCSLYLGVYVAERALSKFFDHIERMPYGNPGYDFICGKGFKIDVKSACRCKQVGRSDGWGFHIRRNCVADYFLCLAFDDRESLAPEHVWLIPGSVLNHLSSAVITESRLAKWSAYEQPLNRVEACCSIMRDETDR